jgi:hypothetical protein
MQAGPCRHESDGGVAVYFSARGQKPADAVSKELRGVQCTILLRCLDASVIDMLVTRQA